MKNTKKQITKKLDKNRNFKPHRFTKELLELLSRETNCGIQHNGCPCNSCFHSFAQNIGLSDNFAHLFWLVVLALRGDYTDETEMYGDEVFQDIINETKWAPAPKK